MTPVASPTKDIKKTAGATTSAAAAGTATTAAPITPSAGPSSTAPSATAQEVTGRLLGTGVAAAPAGVSGTGTRDSAAQGLRAPKRPGDPSPTAALVLAGLLALAALGGAALEARSGRTGLLP